LAVFRSLDFIYAPTRNADEELSVCTKILGGEAVFSIRAFDTRVAAVRFGEAVTLAGGASRGGTAYTDFPRGRLP
jgi:hypothetical protein